MSLFVDVQYVTQISHLLKNFKRKGDYLWNFRCPFCGDSEGNKNKARGYIFRDPRQQDRLGFKCHNCGKLDGFRWFLRSISEDLFKQYIASSFLDDSSKIGHTKPADKKADKAKPDFTFKSKKRFVRPEALTGCPSIASLDADHPARQYIESRKIPAEFLYQLYWTDDFAATAKRVRPDMPPEQTLMAGEGRIIIPLVDSQNKLMGIQGRSLDKKTKLRYITIKAKEENVKVWGMHRLPMPLPNKVYITEGPFDAMFLPYCIAMAGSDIPNTIPREQATLIFDNERRNREICNKIQNAIQKGWRVCIWPTSVDGATFTYKDINEMILAGYTPAKIRQVIDTNSYSGAMALLKLNGWRVEQAAPKAKPRKAA